MERKRKSGLDLGDREEERRGEQKSRLDLDGGEE
jgi:hypothetical protein